MWHRRFRCCQLGYVFLPLPFPSPPPSLTNPCTATHAIHTRTQCKKALHTFQLSTLALPACQIDKMQKETRTEVGVSAAFSGLMLRLVWVSLCVSVSVCAFMCMFVPVQFVQHLPVFDSSLIPCLNSL